MRFTLIALSALLVLLFGAFRDHQAYTASTRTSSKGSSPKGAFPRQEEVHSAHTEQSEATFGQTCEASLPRHPGNSLHRPLHRSDGELCCRVMEVHTMHEDRSYRSELLPKLWRRLGDFLRLQLSSAPQSRDAKAQASQLSRGAMGCSYLLEYLAVESAAQITETESTAGSPRITLPRPQGQERQKQRQRERQGKGQTRAYLATSSCPTATTATQSRCEWRAFPGEQLAQVTNWGTSEECRLASYGGAERHPRGQHSNYSDEYRTDGQPCERPWQSQATAATSVCSQTSLACSMERLPSGSGHALGRLCGGFHKGGRSPGPADPNRQGEHGPGEAPSELLQGCRRCHGAADAGGFFGRRFEGDRPQGGERNRHRQTRIGQHGTDAQQSTAASEPACGIRSTRREKAQESPAKRSRQRCQSWGWRCIYGNACFLSLGRCDVTEVYTQSGHQSPGALKWLHSVTECMDFKSPWGAAWNAMLDAGICPDPTPSAFHPPLRQCCDDDQQHSCRRNVSGHHLVKEPGMVTFADEIDIHTGDDEDPTTWTSLRAPATIFHDWPNKPWNLTFSQRGEAPLSVLAVLSPPGRALGSSTNDDTTSTDGQVEDHDFSSLMQRDGRIPPMTSSTWPQSDMTEDQLQAHLQQLQALVCENAESGGIQGMPDFASSSSAYVPALQPAAQPASVMPQALRNIQHHLHQNGIAHTTDQPLRLVTWYLHHQRHRRCSRWRTVDLHRDPRRWARQIIHKWSDVTSNDEAFQFIAVRPDPPEIPADGVLPTHIILQQNEHAHERSILLTGALPTHTPGLLFHWATVVPHHSTKLHIIEAAGAITFCQPVHDDRRSQVWRGHQMHAHGVDITVERGDNIILVVNNVPAAMPSLTTQAGDERDEIWLMQNQPPRIEHPSRPHEWRESILAHLEHSDASRCMNEDHDGAIRTWYIDHDHIRHCFEPRQWHVSGTPTSWEFQLRRLWYDLVDSYMPLRIVATIAPHRAPEVLLIQGPPSYKCIYLHAPTPVGTSSYPIDIVVSTFSQVSRAQIISHLGMTHVCQDAHCTTWLDNLEVDNDVSVPVQDGSTAIVHLTPTGFLPHEEADASSLLARGPPGLNREVDDNIPPAPEPEDAESPALSNEHDTDPGTDDASELPLHAVWNAVILYRVGQSGIHSRIRSDDHEIRHRQAAHYMSISRHQLLRLHPTKVVPQDLHGTEWPLLAQLAGEISPGASSKYVLIDTEFHNHLPSLEPETIRQCKLISSRLTRTMILSQLGLVPYCRHVGHCLMWLNHELVGTEPPSALTLQHGDYIRIAIPPSPEYSDLDSKSSFAPSP